MTTVTVITGFSSATATMFIVMTCLAAVSIYLVASGSNTGVVTGEIGLLQSHCFSRVRAVAGVALDHSMGHFRC